MDLSSIGNGIKEVAKYAMDAVGNMAEMLLDKLRLNVVIVALLVTWIIIDFGDKLIEKLPENVGVEVIALLIGTGIGGLIAAMIRMFESPQVPADVHERLVKGLAEERRKDE